MSSADLPLVIICGERAVFHLIDPDVPAGELLARFDLYFEPGLALGGRAVWNSSEGSLPLDPGRTIGEQVPADAEIEIRPD